MSDRPGVRGILRGASAIAIAIGVMNVATYGYTILAARLLGPRPYGAFAALMGIMLVVSVLSLALQATAARRISSTPGEVQKIERVILRVGLQASLALGVLCLVLAPVINAVLRLDSLGTAALVGATAVPLSLMGAQAGILQGERRWLPLALIYLASGVPRLALGAVLIVWQPNEFAAMLGVAIGAWAPVIVGAWALGRHERPAEPEDVSEDHGPRELWRETMHNGHALLAFFALTNADVIIARNVLDGHDAGLYAGGLILVKAVLFLPQFIVVLAFPSMATESARRSALVRSMALVIGLGALAAAGTAVLSGLAVVFVGGGEYTQIQHQLWIFAILGTLLSMLQLLVYSVLARQSKRSVFLLWAALLVVVAGGQLIDTYGWLLALVTATDTVLFLVLLTISVRRLPRNAPAQDEAATDAS